MKSLCTVIVVLVVCATVSACTGQAESDLSDWSVFLSWLARPGGSSIVVGVLVSIGYEYVPGFSKLTPKWKRLVFFGSCVLVPVLGALLGILTDGWAATWRETFWPAILAGINVFGSGTITHTPKLPDAPTPSGNDGT